MGWRVRVWARSRSSDADVQTVYAGPTWGHRAADALLTSAPRMPDAIRTARRALTPREWEWTAAFLEGEGWFGKVNRSHSLVVSAGQLQAWPLEKLKALFGGSLIVYRHPQKGHVIHHWSLVGTAAVGLMMTLYCLMSPKRQDQIRAAVAYWRLGRVPGRYRQVCARGHPYSLRGNRGGRQVSRYCRECGRDSERRKRLAANIAKTVRAAVDKLGEPALEIQVRVLVAAPGGAGEEKTHESFDGDG